jgi:LCP family protein required for cell wall assembly
VVKSINSNTTETDLESEVVKKETNNKSYKYHWFVLGAIALVGFVSLVIGILTYKSYFRLAANFLFSSERQVDSTRGKVNILVLGKSGAGHAGADLTDTIIFSSLSLTNPSLTMISLPRDIWVPAIRAKLNSAYYWGKQQSEGDEGFSLLKNSVQEITGQPVHYALIIDFSGFTKIIDVLGGIKVNVENSFVDEKYPIAGKENDTCDGDKTYKCRYETVSFEKGIQFMNGDMALKYVRSRYSTGTEGTDLARDARQQAAIVGVKEKVLSVSTLLNPVKLWKIWKVITQSVETDLTQSAGAILARKMFMARNSIRSFVLLPEFLINPPVSVKYDNQYVFISKTGNWNQVKEWIKGLLTQ